MRVKPNVRASCLHLNSCVLLIFAHLRLLDPTTPAPHVVMYSLHGSPICFLCFFLCKLFSGFRALEDSLDFYCRVDLLLMLCESLLAESASHDALDLLHGEDFLVEGFHLVHALATLVAPGVRVRQ